MREVLQGATHLPLTQRHNGILLTVAAVERPTVTSLAELLGMSVASASRHVSSLESWGLVEKVVSSHDARALSLELTEDGQTVRRRWSERWRAYYVDAMADMTAPQLGSLEVAFERLHAGLIAQQTWPSSFPISLASDADQVTRITAVARWMSLTILHPDYATRLCAAAGMPITPQMLAMLRVVGAEDGVDVGPLAAATNADGSTAGRSALALARMGLVERRRDMRDGRSTQTWLTPYGRHRLLMIECAELEPIDLVLSNWDAAIVDDALRAIEALTANLSREPRDAR